jgi:hypothetical protein
MELVLYAFFVVSLNFGGDVYSHSTKEECEETRAKAIAIVEKEAPKVGEAVYVSPCMKITPILYSKTDKG